MDVELKRRTKILSELGEDQDLECVGGFQTYRTLCEAVF